MAPEYVPKVKVDDINGASSSEPSRTQGAEEDDHTLTFNTFHDLLPKISTTSEADLTPVTEVAEDCHFNNNNNNNNSSTYFKTYADASNHFYVSMDHSVLSIPLAHHARAQCGAKVVANPSDAPALSQDPGSPNPESHSENGPK